MKIIDNVYQLEASNNSHVFLIKGEDSILIDTGMPGLAQKIMKELGSLDVKVMDIKKILLTHHDVDHIGNAKLLAEASGAELWAPTKDIPYITGVKKRPGVKRIVQTLIHVQKPAVIHDFDQWPSTGEIKIIPAPGHTPGHTIMQYKKILFIGDLIEISNGKMQLLSKLMTWNTEELKKSIGILKSLDYDWLCPAHGEPIRRGAVTEEFLKQF